MYGLFFVPSEIILINLTVKLPVMTASLPTSPFQLQYSSLRYLQVSKATSLFCHLGDY